MGELINKLNEYKKMNIYPFHMPGHKRKIGININPYDFDITEITGFDDLSESEDVLKRLEDRIASLYKCDNAYILLNGSTSGVLAAISSVINPKDQILIARNSHKSAYNAVFLRQAKVSYIFPQINSKMGISIEISAEDVEKKLSENKDIKVVYITSPTYEGVISDIKSISDVVHRYGGILIVDCAHGAHLGITNEKNANPLELGADIVIMSLHKTLPAPTQTAVICVKGSKVKSSDIKKYVNIYNSTSPSYLLMCGIEKCIDIIENNEDLFDKYYKNLSDFRNKCLNLNKIYLFNPKCEYDEGKLVFCTDRCNISGLELKDILLQEYGFELEMASKNYAIAMTSIMDDKEVYERFYNSLEEIDKNLTYETDNSKINYKFEITKNMEIYEADIEEREQCFVRDSIGRISADYIYIYPPGIPWVVPGEIISKEIVENIDIYRHNGFRIKGINDNKILVVKRQ